MRYKYFKEHENKHFHLWGLHIYLGKFGQGKTSTMVRDAYNLCCRYEDVTVLTNLKLTNFPKHIKILEVKSIQDILNAPDNTIVLIDEIGTIFNARDFQQNQRKGNGRLCFISQTDSNISRCPQKRWWAKFLNGCTARFKLPHKKPVRSAYARALNGFGKQWLPTLFTLVQCFGYNRIIIALKKEFSRQLKMGKNLYRREIIDNIIDDYNYSEKMNGFKHFLYSSGIPDFYLAKAIREQAQNYCVDFSRIVYSHSRDLEHKTFMEGQCILNGL